MRNIVTGMVGVAVCRSMYLTGCDRISIQPMPKKGETKTPDWETADENVLEVVKGVKKIIPISDKEVTKTGGPQPNPQRR